MIAKGPIQNKKIMHKVQSQRAQSEIEIRVFCIKSNLQDVNCCCLGTVMKCWVLDFRVVFSFEVKTEAARNVRCTSLHFLAFPNMDAKEQFYVFYVCNL